MPFLKLTFRPGINRDTTNYANEGGWYECDNIRFYSGYPQKLGGWIKSAPSTFIGVCRQMWNWITSYQDNFVALGTNKKVYIEVGSVFNDITPIRNPLPAPNQNFTFTTPQTDNCIRTTNGSNTVEVTLPVAHECIPGDYVTIAGVVGNVGGVPDSEINTEHEVVSVISSFTFTVHVATAASSTTSGGGLGIKIGCQINVGLSYGLLGYGWGTGGWGLIAWGESSIDPIYTPQRDWWFDNFDNDLIMNIRAVVQQTNNNPTGGPIYYWARGSNTIASTALSTRAVLLSSLPGASFVPNAVGQILISQNDKHLLAFGAQPYLGQAYGWGLGGWGVFSWGGSSFSEGYDPLLIRWASRNEPQYWNVVGTTPEGRASSAGFLRVSRGSKIVRAIPTRQEIVVFTDSHLYSLQFLANAEIFGLQELSDSISIMGPRAAASVNNVVFWMGKDKFYIYDGRSQVLPCTLREHVFKNINLGQFEQVVCGINESYNEVWWFYCSQNSLTIDSYVVFNYLEQVWFYGSMSRTSWLDKASNGKPLATYSILGNDDYTEDSYLYQHETGLNSDEAPMVSYIQSSDFDIGDGENFMLTRRMIPDINFVSSTAQNPEIDLTVRPRNWPGSNFTNDPSDTQRVIQTSVSQYTNQIFIRARARQMAVKIASDDLGVFWQLGALRLDAREDGKQ